MIKLQIFEPAMCCSTGLCGVSADPELLRISTLINTLEKSGYIIERYNLSNSPQVFVTNKTVNTFVREHGVKDLPITVSEGEIIITGRYPTNQEISELFGMN